MQKVYEHEQLLWVAQAQQILAAADVACSIRNEFSSNVMGEIPFVEVWPELWIHDPGQAPKADALLKQWLKTMRESERTSQDLPNWICGACGEENEGQFALCWSCGLALAEDE